MVSENDLAAIPTVLLGFSYMTSLYVNFKASLAFKKCFYYWHNENLEKTCNSLFAGIYKDTSKLLYMSLLRHKGLGFGFCIAHIFLVY